MLTKSQLRRQRAEQQRQPVLHKDAVARMRYRDEVLTRLHFATPERTLRPDIRPEVDEWLPSPLCHYICDVLDTGEDFTSLDDDGQRTFLALATEVLFGPHFEPELLQEVEYTAHEPI